jgi:hypothetical protein
MPKKWETLPKALRGLIIMSFFIAISFFAVAYFYNIATDSSKVEGSIGSISIAVSGGLAAFIAVFLILFKSYKSLLGAIPIVLVVFTLQFVSFADGFSSSSSALSESNYENTIEMVVDTVYLPEDAYGEEPVAVSDIPNAELVELAQIEQEKLLDSIEELHIIIDSSDMKFQLAMADIKERLAVVEVVKESKSKELFFEEAAVPKVVIVTVLNGQRELVKTEAPPRRLYSTGDLVFDVSVNSNGKVVEFKLVQESSSTNEELIEYGELFVEQCVFSLSQAMELQKIRVKLAVQQ